MTTVLVPRPAATVMVVRDAHESVEVLMLRRRLGSEFVGGAFVFPGGAVDPEDNEAEMISRCSGRSDAEASALLGLDHGGLSHWVCAVRECFEEAGLLIATGPGGRRLGFEDPELQARFEEHRRALNAGERTLLSICRSEDLIVPVDALHYVGHWITPEGLPRRYDTRFFVTIEPPGQRAIHDQLETIDHMWVTPAEALERHQQGAIHMVFPTIWNLGLLSRFGNVAELMESVATDALVPTVAPVMVVDDHGGTQIVMPSGLPDARLRIGSDSKDG